MNNKFPIWQCLMAFQKGFLKNHHTVLLAAFNILFLNNHFTKLFHKSLHTNYIMFGVFNHENVFEH